MVASTLSRVARRPPAWLPAAFGAALYLLIDPHSADLAAQEFRVALFERSGFGIWNNNWYSGHHTVGYSVLFPPLGALVGAQVVGAVSAVASGWLFSLIASARWGERAYAGSLWFSAGAGALLLSGRMTFLLGAAVGLAAVWAWQQGRTALTLLLAAACALASPVAALFLGMAAVAWAVPRASRRGAAVALLVASLGPVAVISGLFPEGGTEPFVASAFWPGLAGLLLVVWLLPSDERELRIGAAIYAAGVVAAFIIDTPLGGNVTRLGSLLAGPVLLCALWGGSRRPAVLALIALPFAYWQLYPPIRDVATISGDKSVHASYYSGVAKFLSTRPDAGGWRVEVPFTQHHWEAKHLALRVPLARGWLRQMDRKENELFYEGDLTPARYERWLRSRGVRYVALADADLDYSAKDEARLVRSRPGFLRPVYRDEHWQVFAVTPDGRRGVPSIVSGAEATVRLTDDGFVLRARSKGTALLKLNESRWWRVTSGPGCIREARGSGDTLSVVVRRPGTIRAQVRLTGGGRC